MESTAGITTRIPVSLRLPPAIVEQVNAYAGKAHLRKTDAFIHFLMLGIEAENGNPENDKLTAIGAQVEEILALLMKECNVDANPESVAESTIPLVQSAVSSAAANYPAIRQVFLFGSMARGAASNESDIDLRLNIDREKGFNLHDLEHFCKAIEQETGREVDAITTRQIKDEVLANAIERDKVLIYEREEE